MGAPLGGATVLAWHGGRGLSDGGASEPDGSYFTTLIDPPPYIIQALGSAKYPAMYSFASGGGTANVTPLTDLLVTRMLGKKVDFDTLNNVPTFTDVQVSTAYAEVVAYLLTRPSKLDGNVVAPVDVSAVKDFVRTPFTPVAGDPYDDALTRLGDSLMESETMQGVEEHMLYANDPPANLMSLFPLEFQANCVSSAPSNPLMPNGPVQVSLKASGQIVIGPYSYNLRPGDGISLVTEPPGQWELRLRGNANPTGTFTTDVIQIIDRATTLELTLLTISGEVSHCTPSPKVPFASTRPNIFPLVRLMANSYAGVGPSPPSFSCATSDVFPGLQQGPNIFLFDSNGALRLNDVNGYTVHLPSMWPAVSADFVAGAAGLDTVPRGFGARRVFKDGYDDLRVDLSDVGITLVSLSTQRGQTTFGVFCVQ